MKKVSKSTRIAIFVLAILCLCLLSVVPILFPGHIPEAAVGVACLFVCPAVLLLLLDTPDPDEGGLDIRALVYWGLVKNLQKLHMISEAEFLGPNEPRGYTHVVIRDTDKSFQFFFSTASDLRKVNRVVRSVLMSVEQCDIVDNKVSSCGMRGFEAVSGARNELYRVFVYRNKYTRHIRVYVHVQTPCPPGLVSEPV